MYIYIYLHIYVCIQLPFFIYVYIDMREGWQAQLYNLALPTTVLFGGDPAMWC